jgi:hypothetical protein
MAKSDIQQGGKRLEENSVYGCPILQENRDGIENFEGCQRFW